MTAGHIDFGGALKRRARHTPRTRSFEIGWRLLRRGHYYECKLASGGDCLCVIRFRLPRWAPRRYIFSFDARRFALLAADAISMKECHAASFNSATAPRGASASHLPNFYRALHDRLSSGLAHFRGGFADDDMARGSQALGAGCADIDAEYQRRRPSGYDCCRAMLTRQRAFTHGQLQGP